MRRGLRSSALVVAAAVLALLVGCGTQAGAAAVVGERRITVSDLQQATRQIERYAGGSQRIDQQQVLFYVMATPFLLEAARRASVGVSEDDARRALEGRVTDPGPATLDFFRANLAVQRIQGLGEQQSQRILQRVIQDMNAAKPRVNPRYGAWDPRTSSITPATQNWIVPSPSPSPSPGEAEPGAEPSPTEPGTGATPEASPAP